MVGYDEFKHHSASKLAMPWSCIELPAEDPDDEGDDPNIALSPAAKAKAKEKRQEPRRHALFILGYRKVKPFVFGPEEIQFLAKNTWSPRWGKKGYAWIKFSDGDLRMGFGSELHFIKLR